MLCIEQRVPSALGFGTRNMVDAQAKGRVEAGLLVMVSVTASAPRSIVK